METKVCCRCGLEKEINDFPKEKGKPRNPCKNCKKEYLKEYYSNNKNKAKEHNKKYYLENKEKMLSLNKEYRLKNKDKIKEKEKIYRKENENIIKEKRKIYYKNNKEKILNKMGEYYIDNREKIIERNTEYYKKNKNHLMNKAKIRNAKRKKEVKNKHSEIILGCSINFFQNYLLETYKKNYGIEWDGIQRVHIDHIIPLCVANTKEDIFKLCHYSNLQLLKAKDNLNKRDKLDWELEK